MEIRVENDGKGKAQSCEATLSIYSDTTYWGHFSADFSGYGANEWSAKINLIEQAEILIEKLNEIIKENR